MEVLDSVSINHNLTSLEVYKLVSCPQNELLWEDMVVHDG